MIKYCCPDCESNPQLGEDLGCMFCGGIYTWKKGKEEAKLLDQVLAKIDIILAGKTNIIYKSELEELRNQIVDIQIKLEE